MRVEAEGSQLTKQAQTRDQRGWGVQVLIVFVFGLLVATIGWMAGDQIDPQLGMRTQQSPTYDQAARR